MTYDRVVVLCDERQFRQVARRGTEALDEPRLIRRAERRFDDRSDRVVVLRSLGADLEWK